jgi:hypothetical protein
MVNFRPVQLIRLLFVPIIVLAGLSASGQINYETYFTDQALRIDYFRTGNADSNTITFDKLLIESQWSGSRTRTIEPYEYGNYKIEVTDFNSGLLLYGYTYSSLFAEYIFTEKGQKEVKTFQESVRIPFPKHSVMITFSERSKDTGNWRKTKDYTFHPEKENPPAPNGNFAVSSKKIHDSGDFRKKADIVFISEGYTESQQDKFFADAVRIAGDLLGCRPFSSHRDKMNIWAVFAASEDEGATNPSENIEKNTVLKSNFSTFGTDRYLMTESHFDLRDIASAVPYDHLIILVNTDQYGGGGIFNFYATCPSDDANSDFLVVHEFGHSFAGLADEYWTSNVSVIEYYNLSLEPPEPNITTLVDFDTKWKSMIGENIPVPTPPEGKYRNSIGVFEGAGYVEKGIFRPFYECTMKSVRYNSFCPVCTKAIEETIRFFSE